MSVDFTYKSVDIWLLSSSKTVTSRKEMLDSENSWVNFMVLCDELMCVINSFFEFFLSMGPNHKNVIYVPPPNEWFEWKLGK